jgi:hypothetical protein
LQTILGLRRRVLEAQTHVARATVRGRRCAGRARAVAGGACSVQLALRPVAALHARAQRERSTMGKMKQQIEVLSRRQER